MGQSFIGKFTLILFGVSLFGLATVVTISVQSNGGWNGKPATANIQSINTK